MFRDDGLLAYERLDWFEVADVTFVILGFLPPSDLRHCSCVNRLLHSVADDDDIWIPLLELEFAVRYRPPIRKLSWTVSARSLRELANQGSGTYPAAGSTMLRRGESSKSLEPNGGQNKKSSGNLKKGKAGNSDSRSEELDAVPDSSNGAKTKFHEEWLKPRDNTLVLIRRMRNAFDMTDYVNLIKDSNFRNSLSEFEDLRSYFDDASKKMHHRMTLWSIRHQVGATITSVGAIMAFAWWTNAPVQVPNSATSTGSAFPFPSSFPSKMVDLLHQGISVDLPAALHTIASTRWTATAVVAATVSGFFNRYKRRKLQSVSSKSGKVLSAQSLPLREKALVCLNYAIKALNDSIFSMLLVPLLMNSVGGYFASLGLQFIPNFLPKLLGAGTMGLLTVGLLFAYRKTGVLPTAVLFLICIVLSRFGISVMDACVPLFRVLTATLSIALYQAARRGYLRRRTPNKTAGFQRGQVRSAMLTTGIFAWCRFLLADSWPNLLWLATLLPRKIVFFRSSATAAPSLNGFGLNGLPLSEAIGYYFIAAGLTRSSGPRAATFLYAGRWSTASLQTLLLDYLNVRILIDHGFAVALLLRVLCSVCFVVTTG